MDLWEKMWREVPGSLFDPGERIFWGSLLGALAVIILRQGRRWRESVAILLSKRLWLHPSSRADLKIILFNALLRAWLLPSSLVLGVGLASVLSLMLTKIWGGKPEWGLGGEWVLGLFTLSLFVIDDFARFLAHYLQHRWAWLWCFHQVHHSALVLTPLTLYRTHPLDIVVARIRDALAYGSVTGVFYFLFGAQLSTWDILGVNAFGFMFNLAGANLRHSEVWIHFGALEPYLISPAAHQIHHSQDPKHYDKNFGVCLALWDRWWGTHWDPRKDQAPLHFGLSGSPLSGPIQSLRVLYLAPFKHLLNMAYRSASTKKC